MKIFHSEEGNILYFAEGEGPLAFLLVHNSGGNHEMMGSVADYFAKQGKVIVPDLLGHSKSDCPNVEYTVKLFAETLIQLCQHEKLKNIIFIGLNYGANIGIEITKLAPSLICRLVLLDPPIFMEPWIAKLVEQQIKDLENPSKQWAEELVHSMIVKAPDPKRMLALKALKSTPAFVKASTFRNLLTWDKTHSFICSIPTLMIQASKPFCEEEKVRKVFTHLEVGRIVASGPWMTLEVPAQVNSMIDRFLEIDAANEKL